MSFYVIDLNGQIIDRVKTAIEGMDAILTHDGYRYEIRPIKKFSGYDLWLSDGSEASTRSARYMVKTLIFSFNDDLDKASLEIAQKVIAVGWQGRPSVMSVEGYHAIFDRDTGFARDTGE